ncbi:MAG: twin-arginine translocation pathway signal protein [Pseudomonadota bacterium]
MKKDTSKADEGRRSFLKLAAVSAPVAAATAVTGEQAEAADSEPQGSGMRNTAHVKAYLDSARF